VALSACLAVPNVAAATCLLLLLPADSTELQKVLAFHQRHQDMPGLPHDSSETMQQPVARSAVAISIAAVQLTTASQLHSHIQSVVPTSATSACRHFHAGCMPNMRQASKNSSTAIHKIIYSCSCCCLTRFATLSTGNPPTAGTTAQPTQQLDQLTSW
jgi:ABC-type uncharacterized transport system YnjBCD permease subunit